MKIEAVRREDASELLAIYGPYVSDTAISFEYEVPTVEEFENRIITVSARYPYLKAVENGMILGYAYASVFKTRKAYERAVETSIYVKMEERRHGMGRALYEALERELREMGFLNMNACIVDPQTEDEYVTKDSVRFHEKMGFSHVGRFHQIGYKFGKWYDMVWMEKLIGEHINQVSPGKQGRKESVF